METELQIDIPLLRKSLEWATAEYRKALRGEMSEWDQESWCGTRCCLAGHVAQETGWKQIGGSFVWRDGVEALVPLVAQVALGIDVWDASRLFHGLNSIETLWDIANDITNGAIEIPADLPT